MAEKSGSSIWETDGYPPTAFYFKVTIDGSQQGEDTSFQEVSGIGPEIQTEEVVEGGENRYVHRLPKPTKHPLLVLKRASAKVKSPLVKWCIEILEGDLSAPIEPKRVIVHLLNENGDPTRSWSFADAYPVQWETGVFNSTKNEVAVETIKLSYSYSKREDS
jgi:phage tail-like protein